MTIITAIMDRICAAAGALVLAQMPMFMVQYHQQIVGRAAEIGLQLQAVSTAAASTGKTFQQYVHKFVESGDPDFVKQGEIIQHISERYQFLISSETALSQASPLVKPFYFFKNLDWEITTSTWSNFQFGVPMSLEGLTYALLGLIFGYMTFFVFTQISRRLYSLFTKTTSTAIP